MTKPAAGTQSAKVSKTKESAFSRIISAARRATSPLVNTGDRSIKNGIAAVFVEQSKLPIALGQSQRSNTVICANGSSAPLDSRVSRSLSSPPLVGSTSAGSNRRVSASPSPKCLQSRTDIFPKNLSKPVTRTHWPKFGDRIDTTPQLVQCATLLPNVSKSDTVSKETPSQPPNDKVLDSYRHEWIAALRDPLEQDHLLQIVQGIIRAFAEDATNDSNDIAEVVILGPILDCEYYRKLLNNVVGKFEESSILMEPLLQALVQLVQGAKLGYLEADDLIKILSILRRRLQATHYQSTGYLYQLTLAVSSVLDVMAEHKINDLDRIQEHEPLTAVLSGLKGTSDPYLLYQASYAFQALQYVPDNETTAQALGRYTLEVVNSMVKLSSVLKLDLGELFEGLNSMAAVAGTMFEGAKTSYGAICSLVESGQGIVENLGNALGSGHKRPWYSAVRRAEFFVREGQLADFYRLVCEAPCRRDPFFQWGICQLLGDIASNVIWDSTSRRQAIELLGVLYKDDPEWGQDESVRTWMQNIIGQLGAIADDAVRISTLALFKELQHDQAVAAKPHYPLKSRLPLPTSSPLLAKVQKVPYLEYELHKLKLQRLKEHKKGVYIPPQAKPSMNATDDTLFPLMEKALEFLNGPRHVLLLLGDSGAGKSTFNLELEHTLWNDYKRHGPIPLHINLPTIDNPTHMLIEKQLECLNFTEDQIHEMKLHRKFILICDGYDESQLKGNIYTTNQFNQAGQWKIKLVISCRSQYLGQDYRSRFQPQPVGPYERTATDLFQEAAIAAFSKEQIQQYVIEYVKEVPADDPLQDRPSWTAEEYMDKLVNIPRLMELVSNPFLLTLALDALPAEVGSKRDLSAIRITRVQLYDSFVKRWLVVNRRRLESNPLSGDERAELEMLVEDNFVHHGMKFQKDLSTSIFFENNRNPVVKYTHLRDLKTWKASFFWPNGQIKLLRESSTVMRSGAYFRFLHRSLLEYFYSRTIYDPLEYVKAADVEDYGEQELEAALDVTTCLARMSIVTEPSIVQFLAERVPQDLSFRQQLLNVIEESKNDASAAIAAANAFTILVKAGVRFNGVDLRGICIPNADLTDGQFDSAQLQGANLTGATLTKSWIHQADFTNAHMAGVRFGELPYLKLPCMINSGSYSPDEKMYTIGLNNGDIEMYDSSDWSKIRTFRGHTNSVMKLAYSLNNLHLVSGGRDATVRLWDIHSDQPRLTLDDYSEPVASVAFSPSGDWFASASDNTIWIRETKTGAHLFVFNEHTRSITGLAFSPSGLQLVSSSNDETIRLWDLAEPSKPGRVIDGDHGVVYCVAFSPDAGGQHIISGHLNRNIHLWDAATGEHLRCFSGHTAGVCSVTFSQDGRWIASSSPDGTARLWDAESGVQLSLFEGHEWVVSEVAFSPMHQQIASCSFDGTVRLWDMSMTGSSSSSSNAIAGGSSLGLNRAVSCVAYSPDGHSIVSGGSEKIVREWDALTGESPRSILADYSTTISCLSYSPNGNQIATAGYDTAVRLNDTRQRSGDGAATTTTTNGGGDLELWGHMGIVSGVAFSPCGQWIASSSFDTTVRLWNTLTGASGSILTGHTGGAICVAYSPSGDQVAAGGEDGSIRIWDPTTTSGEADLELIGHEGTVTTVAYAPVGHQQIASCGVDKAVRLWDTLTGRLQTILRGHSGMLSSLSYSPCGGWLAVGAMDGVVHLWRNNHQQEQQQQHPAKSASASASSSWSSSPLVIRAFHGEVASIAWNPRILQFVTGCEDYSVRVWRVEDKETKEEGSDGVSVHMIWSSYSGRLVAGVANIQGAIGLANIDRTLLLQRGAIEGGPASSSSAFSGERDQFYVEDQAV
ncbi:hypothetical protein BGZ47_006375 [Haplosporangium gracile]|nr:hypothetical protein BGZ47_006375 [Haplosporangium gracile]